MITCNSKTLSVTEWSKETGIAYDTIRDRLNRGWSPERALGFET
jgi:lambda repressor-like predicted transcriptional regulator